jgi:hypothetical protein
VQSEAYKYKYFNSELVDRLVAIYRVMFPHDGIPDEFYEHLSESSTTKQHKTKTCHGVDRASGSAGSGD